MTDNYDELINSILDSNVRLMDELDYIKQNGHACIVSRHNALVNINENKLELKRIENERHKLDRIEFLFRSNTALSEQIAELLKKLTKEQEELL